MLRGDLGNMTKQKQSKADLAAYYQQQTKDQAGLIKNLEARLEKNGKDLVELTQENERLRFEKRQFSDLVTSMREQNEVISQKLAN